jgi:hypothetical protein
VVAVPLVPWVSGESGVAGQLRGHPPTAAGAPVNTAPLS